jgi:hypothetical protein
MKYIEIEAGDTLVLKCKMLVSNQAKEQIKLAMAELLPEGAKVFVLDGGADIEVLKGKCARPLPPVGVVRKGGDGERMD